MSSLGRGIANYGSSSFICKYFALQYMYVEKCDYRFLENYNSLRGYKRRGQ